MSMLQNAKVQTMNWCTFVKWDGIRTFDGPMLIEYLFYFNKSACSRTFTNSVKYSEC